MPTMEFVLTLVVSTFLPIIFSNLQLQALVMFPIVLIPTYFAKLNGKQLVKSFELMKEYRLAISYPLIITLAIALLAAFSGNLRNLV